MILRLFYCSYVFIVPTVSNCESIFNDDDLNLDSEVKIAGAPLNGSPGMVMRCSGPSFRDMNKTELSGSAFSGIMLQIRSQLFD